MDLIGDYGGNELFIIDGESLIQNILDDPLLAIGRDGDCSFQILHAYFSLEQAILEFKQRSANFEIIFWEDYRHSTIKTGATDFVVSSRLLARTMLFKHLAKIDGISVHVFRDLNDPAWKHYYVLKKPMFVLANDGGFANEPEKMEKYSCACVLNRRLFLFHLLASGISFARLNGAEYRELKILAFVNDRDGDPHARELLPQNFWKAASHCEEDFEVALSGTYGQVTLTAQVSVKVSTEALLIDLAQSIKNSGYEGRFTPELLYLFILHCLMLPGLATSSRARPTLKSNAFAKSLTESFLPTVFRTLALLSAAIHDCVDIDGRVFTSILSFLSLNRHESISDLLSMADYTLLQSIWSQLRYPHPSLDLLANRLSLDNAVAQPGANTHSLLPFENEVFDEIFASVKVTVQDAEDRAKVVPAKYFNFTQGLPFHDDKHWHNQKSIVTHNSGGSKPKKLGYYARRRELKRSQVFMQRLQDQAATLTGASGAILRQMIIAPVGTRKEYPSKDRTNVDGKKKKEPKLSSADKLRQQIHAEKATKQERETQSWWEESLNAMSSMSVEQKATYLKALFNNKRSEEPSFRLEMQLYGLDLEFLQWIYDGDRESDLVCDQRTTTIVRMIKDICDDTPLTPTAVKVLKNALNVVGFDEYIPVIVEEVETVEDKRLSFKPVKLVSSRTKESCYPYMRIREDPVLWQLRLFGQFMDRTMGGLPDRRVSFISDAWQRKVLDSIDSNHSLLVVAPTSAGKTFISFYAMERVLRQSDDGILIYVAPTKALVTQVAAEIYARFSKTVANGSCWAIHTRDYRIHDPLHCQILVTVPEILVTMLLSPVVARNWTPRIKWIVLDEIHCIGQQECGAAWEQIILFAPCPIIGLSATVGSPEIFNSWLESIQKVHGFEHTFVQHPYRYSHLRKFYYLLDERRADSFTGLDGYQPTSNTRFLHPISMMSFGVGSIPSDLALEAQDTLTLYRVLERHSKLLGRDIGALDPRQFFSESKGKLLTQKDIILYEVALKDVLSPIFATFDPTDPSSPLHKIFDDLKDPMIASVRPTSLNATPSLPIFLNNLIYLISDLHASDLLPAILFCFDRAGCEKVLEFLLETLETAENNWKQTSPEWKKKIKAWEAWQARAKARERQADRESKHKREDDPGLPNEQKTSRQSSFDPNEPIEQFLFADKRAYSKTELKNDISDLSGLVQPWILRALKRGIGVHHAGMNKGYRALVESLFRQRFIRVLISTGTLALGINAPTKTSVFIGDSPFLTALMFRQCSGRAGRRGYDLLGNVIFYGLTMDRVQRLVLSRLPTLGGNFPLTSTLVLRLCNLLHGSKNAEIAINAIRTITSLSSASFGSEIGRDQILHHLRFSIEYLRRSHLLDMQGRPINLYAIAAHLYYTEPSNLAIVTLMHTGVLHKICEQSSSINAKHQYIHLMCHLFGRRYISRITMNSEIMSNLLRTYPSRVVLSPLPKSICKALNNHDQDVLDIFVAYVVAYSKEHGSRLGPGDCLPLSGIRYTKADGASDEQPRLNQYLERTAIRVTARSIFVANSGHGDHFGTISELARTVRQGVCLNEHAIPSTTHLVRGGTKEYDLNSYLLDFYTHGQTASLIKANGIRANDVWYLLEDFALTLASVKAALEQMFTTNAKSIYERVKEDKTSKSSRHVNSDEGGDANEFELDSGYGTLVDSNLPGDEGDEDGKPEDGEDYLMKRPIGVSNADWKVYEVVSAAREEFMIKFRATWA